MEIFPAETVYRVNHIAVVCNSVVDPDPVGSETFSRIRIRKDLEHLRIRNEFEVKLLRKFFIRNRIRIRSRIRYQLKRIHNTGL
jgi:hypothetical protein